MENLEDIKNIIDKNLDGTVYRVVNRETLNGVGFEKFIKNYAILSINKSPELKLIKRYVDVFCLEDFLDKSLLQKSKEADDIFSDKNVINYLNKKKGNKYFLVYKISKNLTKYCENKKECKILNIGDKLRHKLGNKIFFNTILKKNKIRQIPNIIVNFNSKKQIQNFKKKFKKLIIQDANSFSGFGTTTIENEKDINKAWKDLKGKKIKVAKFIEGPLLSCTGCVTKYGILISPLRYQIIGEPTVTADKYLWCGNDWNIDDLDDKIKDYAYKIVDKIGNHLKNQHSYKGIFGIDFILDKNSDKLYSLELNPRLLGTTQLYASLQVENKEPPLVGFHILEFLNVEYNIDINKLNIKIGEEKKGAHIILRNKFKENVVIKKNLKLGVYIFENDKLIFLRKGYCLQHIKNRRKEFVITAVPNKGKVFEPASQFIRVHTYNKVLDKNKRFLSKRYKLICEELYKTMIN